MFPILLLSLFFSSFFSTPLLTPVTPVTNDFNRTIFSGYIPVNKTGGSDSSLFYVFYSSENQTNTSAPIIIWMNGGPGSSSMLGSFYENGPYQLKEENGKTVEKKRNINWGGDYNLLFVDQPIGTGLSYLSNDQELATDQEKIADHFYNALQAWYALDEFKTLTKNKLIITGESYAGKFVPSIAKRIVEWNQNLDNSSFPNPQKFVKLNLKGISIGDPFTDPLTIMAEVAMFSYNLGIIDYSERMIIEKGILKGFFQAKNHNWKEVHDVFDNDVFQALANFTNNVNVYDIREYGNYDNSALENYFNLPEIKKKYGILDSATYSLGSDKVYQALYKDFMQPVTDKVDFLLQNKIPVLVYNGQDDLIVTSPGTMTWVEKLDYAKNNDFNKDFTVWKSKDGKKVFGYMKSGGLLQMRIVRDAGHLVPMDQPEAALNMISDFINNKCN